MITSILPPGLLPEGLRDRLPGEAEEQSRRVRALLDTIMAHGYDRVAPPLAEFEEGLLERLASSRPQDLLRFVDPLSQRTLAIRPDITPQIGRIVATRLARAPRPLRLAYAGQVLKLRASQLSPAREMLQVGAELIGSDTVAAAREVVQIAVEALAAAGQTDLTVDLTLPDLVETLAPDLPPARLARLRALLDLKDAGTLAAEGFDDWLPLVAASGPVDQALAKLRAFAPLASRLEGIAAIARDLPACVTLDPTDAQGFAYQSWFGFSLYPRNAPATIARGGSYLIDSEPAIGFSIYPDLFPDGCERDPLPRLFLPFATSPAAAAELRASGWRTLAALSPACDPAALGCTHVLVDGRPTPL